MDANPIFSQCTHIHTRSLSVSTATCLLPLLSIVLLNLVAALVLIIKILTINVCGHKKVSSVALFHNNFLSNIYVVKTPLLNNVYKITTRSFVNTQAQSHKSVNINWLVFTKLVENFPTTNICFLSVLSGDLFILSHLHVV